MLQFPIPLVESNDDQAHIREPRRTCFEVVAGRGRLEPFLAIVRLSIESISRYK